MMCSSEVMLCQKVKKACGRCGPPLYRIVRYIQSEEYLELSPGVKIDIERDLGMTGGTNATYFINRLPLDFN